MLKVAFFVANGFYFKQKMYFSRNNSSLWSDTRSMPHEKCLKINKHAGTLIPDHRIVQCIKLVQLRHEKHILSNFFYWLPTNSEILNSFFIWLTYWRRYGQGSDWPGMSRKSK